MFSALLNPTFKYAIINFHTELLRWLTTKTIIHLFKAFSDHNKHFASNDAGAGAQQCARNDNRNLDSNRAGNLSMDQLHPKVFLR